MWSHLTSLLDCYMWERMCEESTQAFSRVEGRPLCRPLGWEQRCSGTVCVCVIVLQRVVINHTVTLGPTAAPAQGPLGVRQGSWGCPEWPNLVRLTSKDSGQTPHLSPSCHFQSPPTSHIPTHSVDRSDTMSYNKLLGKNISFSAKITLNAEPSSR